MAIAATTNEPLDNTIIAGNSNSKGTNSHQDLSNSFLTLLVAQLKNKDQLTR